MPEPRFIHLRVHSAYSLSEGAIPVKQLVKLCQKHGMPAVAVTDTGNLFGALEFAVTASDAGIQPVIGCVVGLRRPVSGRQAMRPAPDQLVLLVQTEQGYRNLMALVSKSFIEGEPGEEPQLELEDLDGRTEGLIALTGGPAGRVGRLLAEGQRAAAEEVLGQLKALFPGRLYVELMRHGIEAEDRVEPALIELAYAHDIPLVATNDAYFADADMYEAHDALLCIADGAYVSQSERRRLTPEHRFKSADEMAALFADVPEAIANTVVIARRCAYMPRKINPILPAFSTGEGRDEAAELRVQAAEGLERRLETAVFTPGMSAPEREEAARPYRERLAFELDVIIQMKFPGYFLIVSDFIKWAKANGIPVGPGRGSGAGSVVAWALTITDLDPLRFGLLFERFLNPERVSMPDFDIDFCQDRRDEVIRYVQGKYGHDRVAQIITFGKLQARAVLRDVGRVLQMPYGQVDRICKMVPNNPANPVTLEQAIDADPMLQDMIRDDESVARLVDIAKKLEGLYRHASTHAAGVVIGDRPLQELVPLYRDPRSDMPVTQFNMKWVEPAGLVKFDFLGLKTLTVLQKAVEHIGRRGIEIDLSAIPLDDQKTFDLLGRAEAMGVFQLESSGMRDVLRRMKPNRLEDLIALVSLYRPGPMDNIPKYIRVKNGEEAPDYMHPLLEPILKETFGIMVYQEQVMQIAQVLAGYTLGGADLLRRAMGKKIKEEMDAQRKLFVDGAVARGVDADQAGAIFDQVNKFAGYGFNKSHAAAYALVAYQTAYLKANYPVEFMAASMTYEMGNTDKLNAFRQELDRLGIRLLPPDVNRSETVFGVEPLADGTRAIRYALAAIKGVGAQAMDAVVAERRANGPFKDPFDFARRLDSKVLNKRQIENLVSAGAFESLNPNRAQMHAAVETMIRFAQSAAQERESGQVSLFGGPAIALSTPDLPKVADWPSLERLRREFEAIGFYLSAHPLDGYGKGLQKLGVVPSNELARRAMNSASSRLRVAGIVVAKQERISQKGSRFAFVTLSDANGVFEVTFFSEILANNREILTPGTPLLLGVDVQVQDEDVRLTAQEVRLLDAAVAQAADGYRIVLTDTAAVEPLRRLLPADARGRNKVRVVVRDGEEEIEIALPGTYLVTAQARSEIAAIAGVAAVQDT